MADRPLSVCRLAETNQSGCDPDHSAPEISAHLKMKAAAFNGLWIGNVDASFHLTHRSI